MRLLIAEDELDLAEALTVFFEKNHFSVDAVHNGFDAYEYASTGEYDAVILDVMMPKLDGLEACMQIRAFSNVPIIMLTARSTDMDKLMGFECGADDYVTKPFNILELKARIRALLRRAGAEQSAAQPESQQLRCGNLVLDLASRSALRDGVPVTLTAKEFDLMELFLRNPNRVFSRTSLLDQVWGYEYQGDDRTVDVHIRRLREKLEEVPASPAYIMTKWGVGYYLKNEDAAR